MMKLPNSRELIKNIAYFLFLFFIFFFSSIIWGPNYRGSMRSFEPLTWREAIHAAPLMALICLVMTIIGYWIEKESKKRE